MAAWLTDTAFSRNRKPPALAGGAFTVAVREGVTETPEFQAKKAQFEEYYSEATGRRKGKRSGAFDYISRHGEVVDALKLWRESSGLPKGHAIVKNVLIDLGVAKGDKLVELFEVKTSTSRTDLYTGIGQLLVHANPSCSMSLVLPAEGAVPKDVQTAIQRLQIAVLRFKFKKSGACITGRVLYDAQLGAAPDRYSATLHSGR